MTNNTPGWAVELVGEKIDLDDWREQLARPFDPWVEDCAAENGTKLLLRTADWASFIEATDVVLDAIRMVERLNGEALLVHDDAILVKRINGSDACRGRFWHPGTITCFGSTLR